MRILFDDAVLVSYGQLYVSSDDLFDMTEAFAGQSNGLCGAGVPGGLFLLTGTHTGRVRFTVELHDDEPPAASADWEEVVEVSYRSPPLEVQLVYSMGERWSPLDLRRNGRAAESYRVRYCVSGLELSREAQGLDVDELAADRYLLRFWPVSDSTPRPDAVIRQTTTDAAQRHDWARRLPPPPTPAQRAAAASQAQRERERREEEYRRRTEARRWGGRAPSERLRRVVGNTTGIAYLDRDLVDAVAEADSDTQRRIAHWAARHAYTFAGIADLHWMAPAWEALDRGEPLPEAFTDTMAMWRRIAGEDIVTQSRLTLNASRSPGLDLDVVLRGDVAPVPMALPALPAAALADPLQAALEALWAAATAYGADAPIFLAEVRRAFPGIGPKYPEHRS